MKKKKGKEKKEEDGQGRDCVRIGESKRVEFWELGFGRIKRTKRQRKVFC